MESAATRPLTVLNGISTKREKLFAGLDVHTLGDLIAFYPRAYEDRSHIAELFSTPDGTCAAFVLEVVSAFSSHRIKSKATGRAMTVQHFSAADDTGSVKITFFNAEYLKNTFTVGRRFRFYGELKFAPGGLSLTTPDFEPYSEALTLDPFLPVYPLCAGLTQKIVSSSVKQALALCLDEIVDPYPEEMRVRCGLIPLADALRGIHFPGSAEELAASRRRLAFDELYQFSYKALFLSKGRREGTARRLCYPDMKSFTATLPFTLTSAQKHAIQDILKDMTHMSSPTDDDGALPDTVPPAMRLVQGDVGSGKTVVACAALYACAKNHCQSVLMAPTGILARQHYEEIGKRLAPFGIRTVLLVGGMKASEKRETLALIEGGEADVVIGTHALLEENVVFHDLALAVTDEQHRFGVMQRKTLETKSAYLMPHTVVMSATPIPRTLALILYCDLDISVIRQMPVGRQPVETFAVGEDKRKRVLSFIRKAVDDGKQAYIVCPLAEQKPEEEMTADNDLKSAKEYCKKLEKSPLGDVCVAYIHGKMKQSEKDDIMLRFSKGEIDVLVSTTVIEVGVNVPNAVIMLVENAERFGLSQLHQLRGRVGRGSDKAYCILMSPLVGKGDGESDCKKRLQVLCDTTDGFVIAEKDLELRGPGEYFGKKQSGAFSFKLASVTADMELMLLAKAEAEQALQTEIGKERIDG